MSKLLFDKEAVQRAKSPLARLIRIILHKEGMTLDDFTASFNRYAKITGMTAKTSNTEKSNYFKALYKDSMTFHMLSFILISILRWEIVKFSITIKRNDVEVTYSNIDEV